MKHTNARPLIIGNWKMNPVSPQAAKEIFLGVRKAAKKYPHATVVVAPPAIYLSELRKLAPAQSVALGVQNIHPAPSGAHTGEHSLPMVMAYDVSYVIIGHSERRVAGESDTAVQEKVAAALKARVTPVICIGESERDSQGNFFLFIEAQIKQALRDVPKTRYKEIVLAYEPIWAIGTGNTATTDDVVEMQLFVHKILNKHFGRAAASGVRFVYGGSVNAGNAAVLFETGVIAGFLVGGASLKVTDFSTIIASTK